MLWNVSLKDSLATSNICLPPLPQENVQSAELLADSVGGAKLRVSMNTHVGIAWIDDWKPVLLCERSQTFFDGKMLCTTVGYSNEKKVTLTNESCMITISIK